MPSIIYSERSDSSNGDVFTRDGSQRAELVLANRPFDLTGINGSRPGSFILQIQGSRSSGSDTDFYVIRPGTDLILPAGTSLDDYAIDIIGYDSRSNLSTQVYTGSRNFEERSDPFWGFTAAVGQAQSGSNLLRYALSTGTRFLAIQVNRDNATGLPRPDPYSLELSFVYRPAPLLSTRLSVISPLSSRAEGNSGQTAYTFTVKRTGLISGVTTVNWRVQGVGGNPATTADFAPGTAFTGSLQFTANQSEKTITLQVLADSAFEQDEAFELVLSGPSTGSELIQPSQRALILNDDAAPATTLRMAATTAGSETGPIASRFTATRSGSLAAPLNVPWTLSGSAINGVDYSGPTSGILTFLAGSPTAFLEIPSLDDPVFDPGKTLTVTLTPPSGTAADPTGSLSASVILSDNDQPKSLSISTSRPGDETGPLSTLFNLSRNDDLASPLSVNWVLSGSAINGIDYSGPISGTITFAARAAGATLEVPTIDDRLVDPGKALTATITLPNGYSVRTGGSLSATAVQLDNDNTLQIVTTTNGSETGPIAARFTATRSGNLAPALNVPWTLSGSAINGVDYSGPTSGLLTFLAGSPTAILEIPTLNDSLIDPGKLLTATLTPPAGFSVAPGGSLSASASLIDNDQLAGTLAIVATSNGMENGSSGPTPRATPSLFTATRSGDLAPALNVPWTLSGSAVSGIDFSGPSSGILTFLAGSPTASLEIPTLDDDFIDADVSLTVTLTPPTGSGLTPGGSLSATALQVDDESADTTAPTVTAIAYGPNDGSLGAGETILLRLTFSETVVVSGAPTLRLNSGGTATYHSGSNSNQLSFSYTPAAGESATDLATAAGNALGLVGAIRDLGGNGATGTSFNDRNPPGIVAVSTPPAPSGTLAIVPTSSGSETGPTPTRFTATRSGNLAPALNVPWTLSGSAVSGIDFSGPSSGILTFLAGSPTASLEIPTLNDALYDPGKTLTVSLAPPAGFKAAPGGALSATASQIDNEPHLLVIAQTRDGNEAGSVAAIFTLSKTGPRSSPLTVAYSLSGSATAGADYTGTSTGTVTFQAGSNTTTLTLPVRDDTVAEANEEILARITAPSGYAVVPGFDVADALILDNDPVTGVAAKGLPGAAVSSTPLQPSTRALSTLQAPISPQPPNPFMAPAPLLEQPILGVPQGPPWGLL